jgi:iron(III) transport system permease protein
MFLTQAASVIEAARILGETPRGVFLRVALPLARPAIVVGVTLALLETLNDVGAAEFLGVKTLTLAIYTTWVTRSDLAGAAQIALSMLFIIVFLLHFEKRARQRQRYSLVQRMRAMTPTVLKGRHIVLAWVLGAIPITFGFILPAGYLVVQVIKRLGQQSSFSSGLIQASFNTLAIASVATVLTVTLGLIVAWAARRVRDSANEQSLGKLFSRLASLGYAVPGTVLAIGLLGPLLLIDQGIEWVLGLAQYKVTTLIVLGSTAGLLMAYVIRFLAIANGSIEAGLARIPPSIEQASRLLGESSSRTLWRVHMPLLKPAMISAALLVFVDTMKELPATLMLRPINFETLATLLYGEASRGMYEEGAVAALMIVLLGLLPVILLARAQQRSV